MKRTLLLKRIEDIRHKLYKLNKTSELHSQEMVECSQELDHLLNLYQTKYAIHPHNYKQKT